MRKKEYALLVKSWRVHPIYVTLGENQHLYYTWAIIITSNKDYFLSVIATHPLSCPSCSRQLWWGWPWPRNQEGRIGSQTLLLNSWVMLGDSPYLSGPLFPHLHPKGFALEDLQGPLHKNTLGFKIVTLCSGSIIASGHSPEPLTCSDTISNMSDVGGGSQAGHSSSVRRL